MARKSTRYFIRETSGIFLELESDIETLPLVDHSFAIFGSSGADQIYVGNGTTVDASDLGTGANKFICRVTSLITR